jgi:hypothetical protein
MKKKVEHLFHIGLTTSQTHMSKKIFTIKLGVHFFDFHLHPFMNLSYKMCIYPNKSISYFLSMGTRQF